jgi:ceramide glucosyltransferase
MIAGAVLVWTFLTSSVGAWAWMRSRNKATGTGRELPRTVLFRPCAGSEPWLAQALGSSSGAPVDTRFLVASEDDGAHAVAADVARRLRDEGGVASVVVTGARGPNRKVDQLARAVAAEGDGADILVVADSDVALSAADIAALVAPLVAGTADATWAPPVEVGAVTMGDRASRAILDASLHSFALLSALDPNGMVGKLFAVRRAALEGVGGFGALADYLGEDMELARRLSAAGGRVVVAPVIARSLVRGRSWSDVLARYARWIRVIRAQRPALVVSYPLLLAATPLQLVCAIAAVVLREPSAILALVGVVAARWAIAVLARVRSGRSLDGIAVAPWLADATLLVAFALALSSRTFSWRGVPLRIKGGGRLAEADR